MEVIVVSLAVDITFHCEKDVEAKLDTAIEQEVDKLKANVKEALINYAINSELGLCPKRWEGYTVKVEVL